MRYMSFLGLFLFKDVISFGASLYLISYFGKKAILRENQMPSEFNLGSKLDGPAQRQPIET
jgi:hypothetical protein